MTRRMMAVKRAVDIGVSLAGLAVLAPLLTIIAIIITLDSPGPALYLSQRIGRNGKPFTMLKFRSMYVDSPIVRNPDGSVRVDRHDARVTRVGRVLRIGFDELPQLFNVLKGDMSLIGPRPDPLEAVAHYQGPERQKLLVRPGMTGLAQVSGRTGIPWRERLEYDIDYVGRQSFWLDCRILFRTALEIISPLRKRRIQSQAHPRGQTTSEATGADAALEQVSGKTR